MCTPQDHEQKCRDKLRFIKRKRTNKICRKINKHKKEEESDI
jgi:hypothetical protein